MLPLSGLPRKPEIWYRILANMGVTVLFVFGVMQLWDKLCFLCSLSKCFSGGWNKVQAPRPADRHLTGKVRGLGKPR